MTMRNALEELVARRHALHAAYPRRRMESSLDQSRSHGSAALRPIVKRLRRSTELRPTYMRQQGGTRWQITEDGTGRQGECVPIKRFPTPRRRCHGVGLARGADQRQENASEARAERALQAMSKASHTSNIVFNNRQCGS